MIANRRYMEFYQTINTRKDDIAYSYPVLSTGDTITPKYMAYDIDAAVHSRGRLAALLTYGGMFLKSAQ